MVFAVEDDGHGLLGGMAGFETLLTLAATHYDSSTVAAQDPAGLGLHALFAHDDVTSVTVRSGTLGVQVDTSRFWDDASYYSTWADRVMAEEPAVPGLRLTVACGPGLATAVAMTL